MISSLLYLTASRPDIMFSVYLCARFQSCPKESHLITVKRIIRYLKGTIEMSLWYPKTEQFFMTSFSDANYAGCKVDREWTSGSYQFLENCLVSWSSKNKILQPSQPPRQSMLRLGLIVHKSFGWNILSLIVICIMILSKYFVITLVLFIWPRIQINIVRPSI